MHTKPRSRGSALIFTLSILILLTSMGLVFVNISQTERRSASNYVATVSARLTALAGVERARLTIWQLTRRLPYDHLQDSWCSCLTDSHDVLAGIPRMIRDNGNLNYSYSSADFSFGQDPTAPVDCTGCVGQPATWEGNYERYGNLYYIKVLDCASQININMESAALKTILANLGERLAYWAGEPNIYGAPNYIADIPGITDYNDPTSEFTKPLSSDEADSIVQLRPPGGYRHKRDIIDIIGLPKYNIIKDFITVHSWMPLVAEFESTGVVPTTNELPAVARIYKAPININTAPRPVLEALLMSLQGRVPLFAIKSIDEATEVDVSGLNEHRQLEYGMEFVDVTGFDAQEIANDIIEHRWNTPFKGLQDLYDFIDQLDSSRLPLKPTTSESGLSTTGWLSDAKWERVCRDVLKANFDPNFRRSRFNFNAAAALVVSKADLYGYDDTNGSYTCGCSTEFCFSSMGRFEINVCARITAHGGQVIAADEITTCLQIFGLQQHTTQTDFESNQINAQNATTYPENREDICKAVGSGQVALYTSNSSGWIEPLTVDSTAIMDNSFITAERIYKNDFNPAEATRDLDCALNEDLATDINKYRAVTQQVYNSNEDNLAVLGDAGVEAQKIKELMGNLPVWLMRASIYDNSSPPLTLTSSTLISSSDLPTVDSDLMPDGIFGHYTRNRYLLYNATPGLTRGTNCLPDSFNCSYYRGTLEFWCKLAIDSGDSIPCGILAITHAYHDSSAAPDVQWDDVNNGREGVQMFIWKTPDNELRVSRLYYGRHYNDNGDSIGLTALQYGDKDNRGIPRLRYCRRELVIPLDSHQDYEQWRAHEWHHVVISWVDEPDTTARLGIDAWIDGQFMTDDPAADPGPPLLNIDTSAHAGSWPLNPRFVVANTKSPCDTLFLGGFVRRQLSGDGIFKFATATFMPLNGTLDAVHIYQEPLIPGDKSPYPGPGQPLVTAATRYSGTATYTGALSLDLPSATPLGYAAWSVLHPKQMRDIIYDDSTPPTWPQISVQVQLGTTLSPWPSNNANNDDQPYLDLGNYVLSSNNDKLYYQVSFSGPTEGLYQVAAIFEDITVTYKQTRILSWEE